MDEKSREVLAARRASFLSAGSDYDRTRPGYPRDGVVWAVGDEPKTIVDLGCGPGKLAAQLAALGHGVIGIDPSRKMLERMTARALLAACGVAEAIPLKSDFADVVTAGQAFHWFDHESAVPEMRRVLRRGGRVGLFWNLRDESVEWVRELSEIIGSEDAMATTLGERDDLEADVEAKLTDDSLFESVEHEVFPHQQELTEEALLGLVRSRSYVAILSDEKRDEVLNSVRRLCREHPQLSGRQSFTMPYKTRVFRARAGP
jgi:SAM-dependent methyltransferase